MRLQTPERTDRPETANVYLPALARITETIDETPDVRTLRLEFVDEDFRNRFEFRAGQFGLYSVFGEGECTFCIASPPTRWEFIECSFKLMGKVTQALRNLSCGDQIGFRGPYGNSFPIERMVNRHLVFIGGGIGFAPVRSILQNCLDKRDEFKEIVILNGARTPEDIVYKEEMSEYEKRDDLTAVRTVDPGGETPEWDGKVGLIPAVLEEMAPSAESDIAIVCGPPIMIKFTLPVLRKLGFARENIITTLENRMKCGLGKCGRCNIGDFYVCADGPVITAEALDRLPADY